MKLIRVEISQAGGSSSLLNGLDVAIRRRGEADTLAFQPLCLIGPNGSGKSQFLQLIAEFFQAALHASVPGEERREVDPSSRFLLHYVISRSDKSSLEVELVGEPETNAGIRSISIRTRAGDDEWSEPKSLDVSSSELLPSRVVAYTSGENETLSLPFLASRIAYAEDITSLALPEQAQSTSRTKKGKGRKSGNATVEASAAPSEQTPRLMLIDYSTHLEVLAANLLLGSSEQRAYLLGKVKLSALRSMRCVVSLNHENVRNSVLKRPDSKRKGVQLTDQLESYIEILKRCSTAWSFEPGEERYVFDFWVDDECRAAFRKNFSDAFDLYLALHKLALLNDLAISRRARLRFEADVGRRRFASRLPEPPDEDKVFRFEELTFYPEPSEGRGAVDYVSLSDGEHQLMQILGVFAMVDEPNVLFLLDEPESHLNPEWRVRFMSDVKALPTRDGRREEAGGGSASQDVMITTHAPFVPSDTPRNRTLIFKRNEDQREGGRVNVLRPNIQTFGAKYEEILSECFGVSPPISDQPLALIKKLLQSENAENVEAGLRKLGPSIERVKLADHLEKLKDD